MPIFELTKHFKYCLNKTIELGNYFAKNLLYICTNRWRKFQEVKILKFKGDWDVKILNFKGDWDEL